MVYTIHTLQICTVTDIHEDTCGPTLYTVQLQDGTKVMATSKALKSVGQVDCSKCTDTISYMSVSDTMKSDESSRLKLRDILTTFPMSAYTGTGFDVVFDSGTSFCVTHDKNDFILDLVPAPHQVSRLEGIAGGLSVQGMGTVEWTFQCEDGSAKVIIVKAFYVPDLKTRLFSPQQFFQESQGGALTLEHNHAKFQWKDNTVLTIPYHNKCNLPIAQATNKSSNFRPMAHLNNINITSDSNINLTPAEKDLLNWHFKLGHVGFSQIKWLSRIGLLPKKISKVKSNPKCQACKYGKAKRQPTKTPGHVPVLPKREGGKISESDLQPGQRFSIDQFVSTKRG